ncbi:MAG: hypothetical protein ACR2GJ_10020 [Gemmatimonadaceae bacterium]
MNPKKGADGKLILSLPMADAKLAGKAAYAIFRKGPAATAGERIGIAGEHLTGAEIATKMSKARALNQELQTFDQWRARNKEKIPLE